MDNLPIYISFVFGLTTILTVWLFYRATNKSWLTLAVLISWLGIQTFIGFSGFYTITNTVPPRFLLLVLPPILLIVVLFNTGKGKLFIDSLEIKTLTILHIVRIPVEIVLFWLFLNKMIPENMTFEGRNFDIISGLTAPIIYYFGFLKRFLDRRIILLWNFICLALLINVVIYAVLSAPFPFQQFAFDQPNVAVLYFPFLWLPACIVPLVLLSHLVVIRQIINGQNIYSQF